MKVSKNARDLLRHLETDGGGADYPKSFELAKPFAIKIADVSKPVEVETALREFLPDGRLKPSGKLACRAAGHMLAGLGVKRSLADISADVAPASSAHDGRQLTVRAELKFGMAKPWRPRKHSASEDEIVAQGLAEDSIGPLIQAIKDGDRGLLFGESEDAHGLRLHAAVAYQEQHWHWTSIKAAFARYEAQTGIAFDEYLRSIREHIRGQFTSAPPPRLRALSDFEIKPKVWLWQNRIALGKLTLLAGDPGQGKSQITCSIAAAITKGRLLPEDGRDVDDLISGHVLMLNCEDDPEDTIAARVMAAGGDARKVYVLDTTLEYDERGQVMNHISAFDADLETLDDLLSDHPEIALITIDPISAYLGKADGNSNSDVRRVLGGLTAIAGKHNVALLAISHLNKGGNAEKAHQRVSGSGAFVAAARTAFMVAPKPECEKDDNGAPTEFVLVQVKNNLAKRTPTLAYTIVDATVKSSKGEAVETSKVKWLGRLKDEITAEEALSGKTNDADRQAARDVAKLWLKDRLADGKPQPSRQLKEAAKRAGISDRMLKHASEELKVLVQKAGFDGGWTWALPVPLGKLVGATKNTTIPRAH